MSILVNASVHRFCNAVAVSLPGKGETVYMQAKEARKLARALTACAKDIGACRFACSPFVTVTIELQNSGKRF